MIPCLYSYDETEYTTNGIGKLSDAVSCSVTEKRNSSYELEMEYPADGIHADSLAEGNIILAKPADDKSSQPFRIYKVTTPLDGVLKIAARHISYQLNFITVSPMGILTGDQYMPQAAMDALKENATIDCPFSFETDVESDEGFTISEPNSVRNCLGGIDGSVLDTYGGEFEWDFYTVRLHKSRGADNGVRVVYGKNLVDFKMEKSIEDTITGVHPYWKDPDTEDVVELSEKVVELSDPAIGFSKVIALDCTERFEVQPTEDQLRDYAESYLTSTSYAEPDIDIDIDFLQLWQTPGYEDIAEAERVSLCDTVHVYLSKLGIEVDATVTETEYDCLLERYKSITLSNSVTSSRCSSIVTSLLTVSQAKAMVNLSESSIRFLVASTYVSSEALEENYSTTAQVESLIEATAENFTLSVTQTLTGYATTETLQTRITQMAEGVTILQTQTTDLEDRVETIESGVHISGAEISLYTSDSAFKNTITNDGWAITESGQAIMTAAENKLTAPRVLVSDAMIIGKCAWKPGNDSHLRLLKYGG